MDIERYKLIFRSLPKNVQTAEVTLSVIDETQLSISGGRIYNSLAFTSNSLNVRASVNNKSGSVSTERLDDDPETLLHQAVENASFVQAISSINSTRSVYVTETEPVESIDDMVAFGCALEREALALPGVIKIRDITLRKRGISYHTIHSLGSDNRYEEYFYIVSIELEGATKNGKAVNAELVRYEKSLNDLCPASIAEKVADKTSIIRSSRDMEPMDLASGTYDIVMLNHVAASLLLSAWMGIIGTYISNGSVIFPFVPGTVIKYEEVFPTTWANDLDPTIMHSAPNGDVIKTLLNQSSDINLISTPTRLFIEPRKNGAKDLITKMTSGLLVTEGYDAIHSINTANGQFSLMCDGIVVENGKSKGAFSKLLISGDMQALFRNIVDTADDLIFMEFMSKSFSYGSPSLLVRGMQISGRNG